jgi:hypothetical protein
MLIRSILIATAMFVVAQTTWAANANSSTQPQREFSERLDDILQWMSDAIEAR